MTTNRYQKISEWAQSRKKERKQNLEESLWQYILDHVEEVELNGVMRASFAVHTKKEFFQKLYSRFKGYRKHDEQLILETSKLKREEYKTVRKRYSEFKKKYPVLARCWTFCKHKTLKTLTFVRNKIHQIVIYLEYKII